MYRYAIINIETGIIEGISNLTGEVNKPDMILITEDFDITNKKYVNGEWIEYIPEPLPPPKPTQLDEIQEQQIIIMTAQADQYEQSLSNRLNDMEVQATLYEAILSLGGNI